MGAINPPKLTDWLCRREPVLKWFHECRGGKLRRRESEGRLGRRRRSSSGREYNFKLQQMLTVTSLGLSSKVGVSGKKKKESRKKGSAVLMKSLLPKTKCASRTPLCGFSSQSWGTVWLLSVSMSWPTADVSYRPNMHARARTHTHTHTQTLRQQCWNRHFLSLTHAYPLPLSCITFSQSLTWSFSLIPVCSQTDVTSEWMKNAHSVSISLFHAVIITLARRWHH